MSAEARRKPWINFAWGIVLTSVGVILWLDQQDRVDARELLEWWSAALILIGAAHLPERRWLSGFAWIAIGAIFLPSFGFSDNIIGTLLSAWPMLISLAGLSLVGQALRPRGPGTMFDATAVMAGNTLLVGSQSVSGANVVAVMGGCNIDLRGVPPPQHEITINVLAFWGGIEIRVPAGWQVIDRVSPILGGFEDKTVRGRADAPRLVVRGSAIMGGVEVKNSEETSA